MIIPTVLTSPAHLSLQFIHLTWSVRISFYGFGFTTLFLTATIFILYFHLKFSFCFLIWLDFYLLDLNSRIVLDELV